MIMNSNYRHACAITAKFYCQPRSDIVAILYPTNHLHSSMTTVQGHTTAYGTKLDWFHGTIIM